MKKNLSAFLVGLLFALGLGIAGMTQPQKVIGFLDLANWDSSLIFVMIGAIGVHSLMYPLVMKRKSPLFDTEFHIPRKKELTKSLVFGSIIFGMGWGLGGFCPGPALASLASGKVTVIAFVAMMILGMFSYRKVERIFTKEK